MILTRFEVAENGEGLPPPKVIVPALFENDGSTVQSEKADPSFEILTTETTLGSNLRVASTAFIFCPAGTTRNDEVKVCPALYEPVLGFSCRVAALAIAVPTKKKTATNITSEKFLKNVMVLIFVFCIGIKVLEELIYYLVDDAPALLANVLFLSLKI